MKVTLIAKISVVILFCFFLFVQTNAIEQAEKLDVQAEGMTADQMVQWVDEQTGHKLLDTDDIVRFDWDKQIFELTRQSAMDFMTKLTGLDKQFEVRLDTDIVYSGSLVSGFSSKAYPHPVIIFPQSTDGLKPPLFEVLAGYPKGFGDRDVRFSKSLENALRQVGVLCDIDVNNPPSPIESVTYGWFGEKGGLRALIEIFPETFRLRRQARMHIHLTGAENLDENHVFDVNAILISNDDKSKFSTKKIFPYHDTGWKDIYVLEMNPWEEAEHSRGRVKWGPAKLSVEIFARKVLGKHAKKYSEPVDHVKTDAIDVTILCGRALLPEKKNKVVIRFRNAINNSDWAKALMYCSKTVKSKAEKYKSAESFFKNVLPMDKLAALPEFEVSSTRSRDNEVISYSCDIQLKVPDYRYSLKWDLSVLKEDSNWVIEFPTKPLDIWLKHEILKMKVANDHLLIEPEKGRAGFEVRLIPLTENFIIGSPMLFRLEMKNISDETLGYLHTSFMVNDPMLVTGPNGSDAPYLDSTYQTGEWPEFIEPRETVVLVDNYDVSSQYHITEPGRYTFQFRGAFAISPSNSIEVDIKPGQLSALESIVEKLMPILPNDWTLTRTRIRDIAGFGSEMEKGVIVSMVGKRGRKGTPGGTVAVSILINPPKSFLEKRKQEDELWGQSKWGPVYVKSLDTGRLWPSYKKQIIKALGIKETKTSSNETLVEFQLHHIQVEGTSESQDSKDSTQNSTIAKQLESSVEVSLFSPDMPFVEAIEELKNSVEPPLNIVVIWRDLEDNTDIDRSTPIGMEPISDVPLKTALKLLLVSLSSEIAEIGYAVEDEIIIIATKKKLQKRMQTKVYDITDLTSAPAEYRSRQ